LDAAAEEELIATTDSDSDSGDEEEHGSRPWPYRKLKGSQRTRLSPRDRRKLILLLRKLDLSRGTIAKAMIFCLDRSDAAEDVMAVILKSLLLPGTPVFPSKIGRLYLVNDLLHNSATNIHNAWKFRSIAQSKLRPVFEAFGEAWRRIPSRLKAEQLRKAVFSAVEAWESWIVFPPDVINDWRKAFTGDARQDGAEASAAVASALVADGEDDEDIDGIAIDSGARTMEKAAEDEDDSDVDGQPLSASAAQPKFVPIATLATVSNEAGGSDDDLDGVPMAM
jgi:hypothetical protein